VSGARRGARKAESEGVRFVDGVEVSVTWEDPRVTSSGCQIDPKTRCCSPARVDPGRPRERGRKKMAKRSPRPAFPTASRGAKTYAENPSLIAARISRATWLKTGRAPDVKSVFSATS